MTTSTMGIPFLFVIVCFGHVVGQNTTEELIDAFIQEVIQCENIPGLTLAVVRNGERFITKGYGLADIDSGEPVTEYTLFNVNSLTKAFAGVSVAIAMRESQSFTWTTPVRDILGDWFYMNDTLRTQVLSVIDALSHRVGLASHNPIRMAGYDTRELASKLEYLESLSDFRHDYNYNNIMYSVAMLVVEQVSGMSWIDYVTQKLFQPLGMTYSGFVSDDTLLPYLAQGYSEDIGGQLRSVDISATRAYYEGVPAAGAILSNAVDMIQWIQFQFNQGTTPNGTEILTPGQFRQTHVKYNHKPGSASIRRPNYPVTYAPPSGYSAGWEETTYRDFILQQHTGSLNSFTSLLMLLPDVKHGVYMSLNKYPSGEARRFIGMYIMDLLLGEEPWLDKDTVCDMLQSHRQETRTLSKLRTSLKGNQQMRNKNKAPFQGTFGNIAYGNITIIEGSPYVLQYGRHEWLFDLEATADPYTFTAIGREPFWFEQYDVVFHQDDLGETDSVTVYFDSDKPPRFDRDIDWNNPPPPPNLC